MYNPPSDQLHPKETTCGSLLSELQQIWDEVGEPDIERDKMILELEQECLEAYRRKVDYASQCRARLRQAVADSEAELAYICAALGELPVHIRQFENNTGSLKKELAAILPQLEEMRKRRSERKSQFVEVLNKIRNISKEIYRSTEDNLYMKVIDESDLSLKNLDELHGQLHALEKEKSDRLRLVLDHLNTLNSLCSVLGMDFKQRIREINPTLDDSTSTNNISVDTIERLSTVISSLREVKIQRMQKLQDFATTMVELWTLMDTPFEEQKMFQNVTRIIAASENEITQPDTLSLDFIKFAESEVLRLQQMKSSKMKEVILKKRLDLEELCRKAHMVAEAHSAMDYSVEAIESGAIDPSYLLEQIELKIAKVKEEAFSRKDILERVEKWLAACEEECWLEEYNRDDNRYKAGRGTHLILKRAEKARTLVGKIPAMVEALSLKTRAWEQERGVEFSYDGVRLLSMLDQYSILKQEKEQERQRQRDQKKLQGQLIAEQEVLYGSQASPTKSMKKGSRVSSVGVFNKRVSLAASMLHQTPKTDKSSLSSRPLKKHYQQNRHQAGGFGSLPSGMKNASNANEIDPTATRKPLSPVSSTFSSNANATNIQDETLIQNGPLHKTPPANKTPVSTQAKYTCTGDEESRTPKNRPVPVPSTPSTITIAMQTAITPFTPCVPRGVEEIEYSFEERRAGFVIPNTPPKALF